jgi:hypothetical protein
MGQSPQSQPRWPLWILGFTLLLLLGLTYGYLLEPEALGMVH